MPTPRTRLLLLGLALLAPALPARADVAPPDDYVDPCESADLDASCRRCTTPEFKDPGCHEAAKAAGASERCRGWGYAMYCGGDPPALAGPSLDPGAAPPATVEVSPPPTTPTTPTPTPPVGAPASKDTPTDADPAPPAAGGCTVTRSDLAAPVIFALILGVRRGRRRAA